MNFDQAKDQYLKTLTVQGYSPLTVSGYRRSLDTLGWHLKMNGDPVSKLKGNQLEGFGEYLSEYRSLKTGKNLGDLRKHGHMETAKRFLRFIHKKELTTKDLSKVIQTGNRPRPLPKGIMSEREVNKILKQPNVRTIEGLRNRAMLEVLYGSGLRSDEFHRLDISDIDFEHGFVGVRKGKGSIDRVVPLSSEARKWLERYLKEARPVLAEQGKPTTALWLSSVGNRLCKTTLINLIKGYKAKAGVKKQGSTHAFRHSIATHLLDRGMDIRYIQKFLGHRSIMSTEIYAHVAVDGLRKWMIKTHPMQKGDIELPTWKAA